MSEIFQALQSRKQYMYAIIQSIRWFEMIKSRAG